MGRILGLQLRQIDTLASERTLRLEYEDLVRSLQRRQRLLEEFGRVQRAIATRAELPDILDSITRGAHALFEQDVVTLRLLDPDDSDYLQLASHRGLPDAFSDAAPRIPTSTPGFVEALQVGRMYVADAEVIERIALAAHYQAATALMIAPVSEDGTNVGALLVASYVPDRVYDAADQEMLQGFADHVSMALTDARGVEALHQAYHDALTSLPNRSMLKRKLTNALARGSCGLLFIDLDRFKLVNDSLGHEAGDQLLIETADRLRAVATPSTTVARYGGDEFVALVDQEIGDISEVTAVGERMLAAMQPPFCLSGRQCTVGASIGVTVAGGRRPSEPAPTADEVLRNADVAMYRAKQQGRGRVEVFQPEMHAALMERLDLEADLRYAISRGELSLVYQPVVELSSMRPASVEALVRWNHPHRGRLSPAVFIPLAEETGLIAGIGRWVAGEAARALRRWDAVLPYALAVNVNLPASHLRMPGAVPELASIVRAEGVDLQRIVVEVTETELVTQHDSAVDALYALRELGVTVAVDDFGTGFSSLRYLRELPVNTVKIDASFIADIDVSPEALAFARSIVGLGTALSLHTVAEGIERESQLVELRRMGCAFGQGYHLAKPLTEADVVTWMLARAPADVLMDQPPR
jgi:diguanylate cyclase (GGDEF)-like protein